MVNFFHPCKTPYKVKWIYSHSAIILSVLYYGCNSQPQQNNNTVATSKKEEKVGLIQLLIGNGTNFFRGVNLGADSKTVLNSEKKAPDENDTGDIIYTLPIDTLQPDSVNETIDSVNYYTINYYFDKGKLNEIDEDVFLQNDSVAANLMERLTGYLNAKYGNYATQNDSRVWSTTYHGIKQWVTLCDQSEEYDSGKLLLVFYCEEY